MPTQVNDKLINWASNIDEGTLRQAEATARLPIIAGHVALMPDAHFGMGATVGSVIPTESAIIPAAVGVDIGCGMVAVHTSLTAEHLPDNLNHFFPALRETVPAGLNQGHEQSSRAAEKWFREHPPTHELERKQATKALLQLGSLGSGNHFFEICLDENDNVWLVLHSGSRGIGNQLARGHVERAKKLTFAHPLEDKDLAYFEQGTPEFDAYITDMLWGQEYAYANRDIMIRAAIKAFWEFLQPPNNLKMPANADIINCHHNYSQVEQHDGKNLWITRKGAIKADTGDLGVIPGSMGTRSYIVRGLGNPASYHSCSHGAGRVMSRSRAKRELSIESLHEAMAGKAWQSRDAEALLDEHPASYKDIDQVMEDQKDLVEVVHTLHQVLNYKGSDDTRGKRRR